MDELTYTHAVLLGLVQGLAEFLPISSSGHLAITQNWLRLDPDSQPMLVLDVASHAATVLAVLVVFSRPIREFLVRLYTEFAAVANAGAATDVHPPRPDADERPGPARGFVAWRLVGLAVLAGVPTGAVGLGLKDVLEAAFGKPLWIGAALVATGVLLATTTIVPHGRRGWRRMRWWHAVLVGAAQAAAILPGISRSGATICTALYCGVTRRRAAQFSFLIAVPAILAATAIKGGDVLRLPADEAAALPWGPIAAGCVVAFASGVLSLSLLLRIVRLSRLHYFAPYCVLLGILVITLANR